MKKTVIFRCLLFLAMVFSPLGLFAQVTISAGTAPQSFSVLELISNQTKGLRLPQMTVAQRNTLQASFGALATTEALGLQIFNTVTRCIETWNGSDWISTCGSTTAPPSVDPILCGTPPVPVSIPVFMAYNLGADPTLDTPKKQMEYLANTGGGSSATNNGRVYGGRYQWGRANLPYAISTDGSYTLYAGTTNSANRTGPTYDSSTGQILTNNAPSVSSDASTLHIFDNNTDGDNVSDWRITTPNQQLNNLWDSNGGVLGGTPSKSINDPCPNGWRVPTQNEWELLGNYDCDPTAAGGTVTVSGGIGHTDNNCTWVAVVCGGGVCTQSNAWTDTSNSGYAIYRTDVWNDTSWSSTGNLLDSGVPEPFLFLPAAGFRSNSTGTVSSVGTNGTYWTNTVTSNGARFLSFSNATIYPTTPTHVQAV